MKKVRVLTYGTFDYLHIGHINILDKARCLGDYLIVGLSTDAFNSEKNKRSYGTFQDRKKILEAIRYVDQVIPEESWGQKINDIKNHDIDIFVMGDDWQGKFDFLEDFCEVVYCPRTKSISSSIIRSDLEVAR